MGGSAIPWSHQIEIRVMHHVQSPKNRNRMMENMLQVDREIRRITATATLSQYGRPHAIQKSPVLFLGEKGHPNRQNRENQAHGNGI